MWHSIVLAVVASLVVVVLGLILAYAHRSQRGKRINTFLRLASVGYAMPGTVLGIGVLIPLAYFDNSVDAFMRSSFGVSTGLLLSGTITAIIFAYAIRFLAISFGSLESGLEKVTPNLIFAARTLGRTPLRTVMEIHLPISAPGAHYGHTSGVCRLHEGVACHAHPAAIRFRYAGNPGVYPLFA